MNQDRCNIHWQRHTDHLKERLYDMLELNVLSDVTLVCDDKKVLHAHKIVLSACSPLFENIVKEHPNNNPVIFLRGIQHPEMESILKFMYLGETTISKERLNEFLNVVKSLEIEEINKKGRLGDDVNKDTEELYTEEKDQEKMDSNKELATEQSLNKIEPSLEQGDSKSKQLNVNVGNSNQPSEISQNDTDKEIYYCSQCEYRCISRKGLIVHIESTHGGVNYLCDMCNFESPKESSLKKHIKAKHEAKHVEKTVVKTKYSSCDNCKKEFKKQSAKIWTRHVERCKLYGPGSDYY